MKMKQIKIKDIKEGDSAYTFPWAVVNICGKFFFYNAYFASEEPEGDMTMKIERTREGLRVHLPAGRKYEQYDRIPWYGVDEEDLLLVEVCLS